MRHQRQIFLPALFAGMLLLAALSGATPASANNKANANTTRVLVSTFPIYQIARNVALNSSALSLELMIPSTLGCPHDYALSPKDLRTIAQAEVLLINGLGMEEFLDAALKQANPRIHVIDSSKGLKAILHYADGAEAEASADNHQDEPSTIKHPQKTEQEHDEHGEHASGANPHLFASPRMAALIAENIATAFASLDPAGKSLYEANAKVYASKLNTLADAFSTVGKEVKNNRIVTQHGVFDYLARDMGLQIVAVVAAHAGKEPSAAEVLRLVQAIKEHQAAALFTEPQYPQAIGKTIAKEAAIPAALLDPVANGPQDAPLDYYERIMRQNLHTLADTLGRKQ